MEKIRMLDYMVHFKTNEHRLEFEVYPIQDWEHLPTGNKGISYIEKYNESNAIEFNEETCLKKLQGSFCWRGVWEGRLYFTDDEYWGEDIEELSDLYNNYIVKWCKEFIVKRSPNEYYDD